MRNFLPFLLVTSFSSAESEPDSSQVENNYPFFETCFNASEWPSPQYSGDWNRYCDGDTPKAWAMDRGCRGVYWFSYGQVGAQEKSLKNCRDATVKNHGGDDVSDDDFSCGLLDIDGNICEKTNDNNAAFRQRRATHKEMANVYVETKRRAQEMYCEERHKKVLEIVKSSDRNGSDLSEEPSENDLYSRFSQLLTVSFPMLGDRSEKGLFKPERPWRHAFFSRGFTEVTEPHAATFVVTKQPTLLRHLNFVGFHGPCNTSQVLNQAGEISGWNNKQLFFRKMTKYSMQFGIKLEELIPLTFDVGATVADDEISITGQVNQPHRKRRPGCYNWLNLATKVKEAEESSTSSNWTQTRWIKKDAGRDNQLGIELLSPEVLENHLKEFKSSKNYCPYSGSVVVQKLMHPPLLLHNKHKLEIRAYIWIMSTRPFMAFIHPMMLVKAGGAVYNVDQTVSTPETSGNITAQPLGKQNHMMTLTGLRQRLGQTSAWQDAVYLKAKKLCSQALLFIREDTLKESYTTTGTYSLLGVDMFLAENEGLEDDLHPEVPEMKIGEINFSAQMSGDLRWMPTWRLEFQNDMLREVLDVQLALFQSVLNLDGGANDDDVREKIALSSVNRLEIITLRNWTWHEEFKSQKCQASSNDMCHDYSHAQQIHYVDSMIGPKNFRA